MEVADGCTIYVLEWCRIHCIGSAVECQRLTLAVECSFERMCSTCHSRYGDVIGKLYSLAVEGIE